MGLEKRLSDIRVVSQGTPEYDRAIETQLATESPQSR